jgi:hypothetical protein
MLEQDFNDSNEIDYQRWLGRGRWLRLYEYLWGRIERWLDRFWPSRP